MLRLRILTIISLVLAVAIHFLRPQPPAIIPAGKGLVVNKEWLLPNAHPHTPAKDCRPPDQTFLTYPEWFLVFSPEEQAHYYAHHTATSFPYSAHTAQIWGSYSIVCDQIKDNFPVNKGYHFMIWVIGSSATVEYGIKSWYEELFGRLTDTYVPVTAEDNMNAAFTADYVRFIKDRPWYEFDFRHWMNCLWHETPMLGDHMLRKWERRYILTSELAVKTVYGKLIGLGTKTVYDVALPSSAVVMAKADPQGQLHDTVSAVLPRYDQFYHAADSCAASGYRFCEIAGSNSAILITILTPSGKSYTIPDTRLLFTQPISSAPDSQRVAIVTTVPHLHEVLNSLRTSSVHVEHVFDY